MLLPDPGEVAPSDRLVEALWADKPPAAARHAVEVNVSRLHKTLGASNAGDCALITRVPGYLLQVRERPDGLPVEQVAQDPTVRYFHHDQLGSADQRGDTASC